MVGITVRNLQKKIRIYPQKIKEKISKVIKKEKIKSDINITICFINDTLIRRLNKKYLKKNYPTDVLAFNLTDSERRDGLQAEILISTETALRNARRFKTTPAYELSLYAIHGLLHLLGYDDHSLREQKLMHKKELEYVHT